ncbi:MAG: DnaA N-terminal domain-containing protein, partial [Rickettsiales bacterium]|nr:DnaA N-terminal domain-containing protein [Rickettsiales bacterium]
MIEIKNTYSSNLEIESSLQKIWQDFCTKFSSLKGDSIFHSWIKPLEISEINSGFVEIKCPSRFVKNWVLSNYLSIIEKIFAEIISDFKRVDLIVAKPHPTTIATILEKQSEQIFSENTTSQQLNLPIAKENFFENFLANKLDAKFTFDNYSSFENNILAFNACYNIACNSEGFEDINLLFICGKMGLG